MFGILSFLQGTPWWVFLIFAYLIIMGLRATKKNVIPIRRIFIVPIILIGMKCYSFLSILRHGSVFVLVSMFLQYSLLLGFGGFIGWSFAQKIQIYSLKESNSIVVPGSLHMFILLMLLFSLKYYVGYMIALGDTENMYVQLITRAILPVMTGILLGRSCNFLYRFYNAKHV